MVILYRKNKLGIGSWRIWNEASRIYIAHCNSVGGSEVIHHELVAGGLAGRTMEEQVQSRIDSRIKKQKDRGYVVSLDEAINLPLTNMLDQPPPMLAKKFGDLRGWAGEYYMQPKLDGFRCLISSTADDGIVAYTRGGIELGAITHITNALKGKIPEGVVLDGEIYQHGVPLQKIASLAKRQQVETKNLVYHVYDSVSKDTFESRYETAMDVLNSVDSKHLTMVPNRLVVNQEQMWNLFQDFRQDGYEGGILRDIHMPYEPGTRSMGLIKVKAREDAEFEVEDVIPGMDGLGILVCRMKSGQTFKTLAPGDHEKKRFILENKDHYIGALVHVEFANYTTDGIPFHAVAIRFMET